MTVDRQVRLRTPAVRLLGLCGIVGPVVFTISWVVLSMIEPHFSFVNNDGSDLGALTAPHAVIWNIVVSTTGGLIALFSIALFRMFGGHIARSAASLMVLIAGAGLVIDGFFREDCSAATDSACRARLESGQVSFHFQVHIVESVITLTVLAAAPIVLGVAFRFLPEWRNLAGFSLCSGAIQIVCGVASLVLIYSGDRGQGVVEFVGVTAGMAWLAVLGARLIGREQAGSETAVLSRRLRPSPSRTGDQP